MKKSIVDLKKQIVALNIRIERIQKNCKHENVIIKHDGNTGNYDPSSDCYWTDYKCPDCDKIWREYQ